MNIVEIRAQVKAGNPPQWAVILAEANRLAQAMIDAETRAAGLEMELQHCKAKREQAERERDEALMVYRQYLEHMDAVTKELREERNVAVARAEAAEAALEDAEWQTRKLQRELEMWKSRYGAAEAENMRLRRVAEAIQSIPLIWNPSFEDSPVQHLRSWASFFESWGEPRIARWFVELGDALAAWDAARVSTDEGGEGGNDEQET